MGLCLYKIGPQGFAVLAKSCQLSEDLTKARHQLLAFSGVANGHIGACQFAAVVAVLSAGSGAELGADARYNDAGADIGEAKQHKRHSEAIVQQHISLAARVETNHRFPEVVVILDSLFEVCRPG